jgi:hypothetical protein
MQENFLLTWQRLSHCGINCSVFHAYMAKIKSLWHQLLFFAMKARKTEQLMPQLLNLCHVSKKNRTIDATMT